jgi:hypothetical protein
MQLTAKLTQLLPIQTGSGKNGEWKKQDIIVETDGQYPKKVCVSIWGDKINEGQLVIGNNLKINFEIESEELNGKYFNNVIANKIVQIVDTNELYFANIDNCNIRKVLNTINVTRNELFKTIGIQDIIKIKDNLYKFYNPHGGDFYFENRVSIFLANQFTLTHYSAILDEELSSEMFVLTAVIDPSQ